MLYKKFSARYCLLDFQHVLDPSIASNHTALRHIASTTSHGPCIVCTYPSNKRGGARILRAFLSIHFGQDSTLFHVPVQDIMCHVPSTETQELRCTCVFVFSHFVGVRRIGDRLCMYHCDHAQSNRTYTLHSEFGYSHTDVHTDNTMTPPPTFPI